MNPQEHEQAPAFELPAAQPPEQAVPNFGEQQANIVSESVHAQAIEQGVSTPQGPPAAQPASPLASPQAAPPQGPPAAQPSAATQPGIPQIADDTDLIEKEWVLKAKQIVASTSHDPHLQNKEMNKFKAEYLKKRYNKDIKLSKDM